MDILIKALQFFLSLTLLVTVHEFGHFIVARLFKIRVDKFYIFFDWGFSLFKFRRGDTEYGMGWLPLGGYCKIAGMVDESMDKEQLAQAPQDWEYRSKPAWQRFFVLIAGVTMNVLLAFVIYCGIAYSWGTSYIANEDAVLGYKFNNAAQELGLRTGDKIVTINGEKIEDMADIFPNIILTDGSVAVEVVRDGEPYAFTIDEEKLNAIRSNTDNFKGFCSPRIPFDIESVQSETARQAGLSAGDRIIGIDSIAEENFIEYDTLLKARSGKDAVLTIIRQDSTLQLTVPISADGKIGVSVATPFEPRTRTYTFWESIPAGWNLTVSTIDNYWQQLKLIFQPKTGLYKQVGGFIAIANIFPDEWDWHRFWSMTAFLSIILAIMNIIPIPGLDGGHTLFTLYEMVTRRKVSDRVLEIAQYVGLLLILALVLFANGNDIYRLFK
ncbi:MAG: RIP metalloprotease RseP [Alistipes sp.]|nr:RIP metalloprotease RseP [Alistipes sp.]